VQKIGRLRHVGGDRQDQRHSLAIHNATNTPAAIIATKPKSATAERGAQEKEQRAIEAGDAARQASARAVASADAARRKAEAAETRFNGKIDRLQAALRGMV
jgi:hypothetical protein